LDGVLRDRAADLHGILNGVDYDEWNPGHDPSLVTQYTARNLDVKSESKKALCSEMGLPYSPKTPLFGIVSRLTDQKGFDLLAEVLKPFLEMDVQLVILGTGEQRYQDLLVELRGLYPGKLGLKIGFDNGLSRRIYGGSDMFLMPSRFEPCGLGQLISLRYGSIPVVRKTGGLADTIEDLSEDGSTGNGFVFEHYTGEAFLTSLRRSADVYRDHKVWRALMVRAMGQDFSWNASAQKYLDLFRQILQKP
jgi:starch synthase